MSSSEIIGSAVGVAGLMGALFAWAIKAVMAPIKVSIDNNTRVIERISDKLEAHDERLDDHGNRIVAIETKHRVRHGNE